MNNNPTYQQPLCSPCATCDESNTTTTRKQDENETKTTANDAVRCVPQLRFPEFQNEGEWETVSFADLFSLLSNNTLSRAELSTEGEGIYNIHYGDILIKYPSYVDIQKTTLPCIKEADKISNIINVQLQDGDIVIADTAEDETAGKCIEIGNLKNKVVVAGLHTIPCRPNRRFAPAYLGYYMNSHCFHSKLLPIMQGVKVTSISRSALKKVILTYPSSLEEQQKIASCLLSIDEDISATTQKLEQLKTHKKALLQKLFPQRGKTIPEFRFPEFDTASEWNKKKLGDVADVVQGYGFPERMQGKSKGECPFIKVSDISAAVNKGSRLIDESVNYVDINDLETLRAIPFPQGTIIFAKIGEAIRLNRRVILNRESLIDNNIAGVKARSNVILDDYLYYVMLGIDLIKYAGGVVPSVKKSTIEGIEILLPQTLVEQQKITYCMQSIDDDIFATIKRLELLQTQKKALMQQLFVK